MYRGLKGVFEKGRSGQALSVVSSDRKKKKKAISMKDSMFHQEMYFTGRVIKHRSRLPRDVVKSKFAAFSVILRL